jgi:hypothetical protein
MLESISCQKVTLLRAERDFNLYSPNDVATQLGFIFDESVPIKIIWRYARAA